LVKPVTVTGEFAPVPVRPPGLEVTVYKVIAAPPVNAGAVKLTVAWVSPAVALAAVGAPGTTALILNERLTVAAAEKLLSPASSASMVQVPVVTMVNTPPLVTVQTPVVDELKVGIKLDEDDALSVGVVPKSCAPGLLKVIVCAALGVTESDAAEAEPVPAEFVATAVKV
jgi:hypothetical protein